MSEADTTSTAVGGGQVMTTAPPRSILAPYRVFNDFLDAASVKAMLALTLSEEAAFQPSKVGPPGGVANRDVRISNVLRNREALKPIFAERLQDLTSGLVESMRLSHFTVAGVELELAAHGDGAFYKRHVDTGTGGVSTSLRVLSGVYYFHHQPKGFSGGALRLYSIGDHNAFVDIEPVHNSLLVFPSWAPHEVMPVRCPSGRFIDSRFAVNCWLHCKIEVATQD